MNNESEGAESFFFELTEATGAGLLSPEMAEVVIIDINHARLSYIDDVFDGKVVTLMSNRRNIREAAATCDMLVGAVLVVGQQVQRLGIDFEHKTHAFF